MEPASDESIALIPFHEVEATIARLRHLNNQAQSNINPTLPVARQILASFQHRSIWKPWGWKYLRSAMRNIEHETRICLQGVEQYAESYRPHTEIIGLNEWQTLASSDVAGLSARQRQHLHHLQRRFTRRLKQQEIDHEQLVTKVGKLRVISGRFRQITKLPLPVEAPPLKVSSDS